MYLVDVERIWPIPSIQSKWISNISNFHAAPVAPAAEGQCKLLAAPSPRNSPVGISAMEQDFRRKKRWEKWVKSWDFMVVEWDFSSTLMSDG